jgi:small subunit ribosomal protein S15
MLTTEEKNNLIKKYGIHETDTGSTEIQIALLTENIQKILTHLKKHSKDQHTRYGLLKMVIKRKKFLKYLEKKDKRKYNALIKKIGLKSKSA